MRLPRALALAVGILVFGIHPAGAAFELRDASPSALGAVSTDLDVDPMFDRPYQSGWRLAASHAALFQVEGLTAEQASARFAARPGSVDLSLLQLGVPGEREVRARAHLAETPARGIAIAITAERLDLRIEGEGPAGGWACGAAVRIQILLRRLTAEVALEADRLWESGGLRAMGVDPSVPVTIRLRSSSASVAWIDHWEADGRHSPRLVVDIGLGSAGRLRFGRGGSPSRTGASFGIRLRRLEVLVGTLEAAMNGTISGASIGLSR